MHHKPQAFTLDFVAFLFVPFVLGRQAGVARLHHQRPHDAQGKDGAGNGDQTGKPDGTDKHVHCNEKEGNKSRQVERG